MVAIYHGYPPVPPCPFTPDERRAGRDAKRAQVAMNASVQTFRTWALEQRNQALHDAMGLTGEEEERCMQKVRLFFEAWQATVVFEREFGADRGN